MCYTKKIHVKHKTSRVIKHDFQLILLQICQEHASLILARAKIFGLRHKTVQPSFDWKNKKKQHVDNIISTFSPIDKDAYYCITFRRRKTWVFCLSSKWQKCCARNKKRLNKLLYALIWDHFDSSQYLDDKSYLFVNLKIHR